jgi:hypothetical protein
MGSKPGSDDGTVTATVNWTDVRIWTIRASGKWPVKGAAGYVVA